MQYHLLKNGYPLMLIANHIFLKLKTEVYFYIITGICLFNILCFCIFNFIILIDQFFTSE